MAQADIDRIDALSGGAPLPQAATQTIARRLLGSMADRYGDVIGTRERNAGDVARDFSIGFISGDPGKADELKMRVAQGYAQELRREDDQRIQREQAARQQLQGFFSLLEQGRRVPKELRQDFFKESLPQVGVDPTSPLFLKILSNYEKFGDIYDALADPEIQELADKDPLSAVERLVAMGHNGADALAVAKSVQEMKRYRAETQRILSQAHRLDRSPAGGSTADPTARARTTLMNRLLTQTRKNVLGEPIPLTPEDVDNVMRIVNQVYPLAGAPVGIPQDVPPPAPVPSPTSEGPEVNATGDLEPTPDYAATVNPPPAPAINPASATTTTATSPAGYPRSAGAPIPVGIAQATPRAAASPRKITGTVTRVAE